MNKIYTRINWENYPSEATALNETNLNKMDFALDEVDNRLIEQDTTKLSKTDASNDVVNWTMDEETGVITVTRRSGEQILFDLNIEKIPVSFSLSDDGILTMVTDDGTTFTANIGAMIPILTFNDSDEIAVSVSGTGINKTYSFSVKDNSITENKLQPNFLADIKVQSASASLSASNAETNATKSQSYAVGGTGTRGENEDTDNAKYYNEQAQKALSEMQKSQVTGVKGNNETTFRTGNVNITSDDVGSVAVGGDVAENTVTYESSDVGPDGVPSLISLEKFTTGEKLSSLIKKTSIIANNFRYFLKMLGTNDISAIGDGTLTGAISTLNSNVVQCYIRIPEDSMPYNSFSDEYFYGWQGSTPMYYRFWKTQILPDTNNYGIAIPEYMKKIITIDPVVKVYENGSGKTNSNGIAFWVYGDMLNVQNMQVIGSNNYGICKVIYVK